MRREIEVVKDADALTARAAERFASAAEGAIREHGDFRVALSGGGTPRTTLYPLLRDRYKGKISWDRVWFYWGDERCVPPDHEGSNFRMTREALLDGLSIDPSRIRRMEGELEPEEAARRYEDVLRRDFALASGRIPRFDLALMGLGADGHTASLFPGSPVLEERSRLARGASMEVVKASRITLTFPVFNAAARVLFIASGENKAEPARKAIEGSEPRVPAGRVQPIDGELVWLLDEAAAVSLSARRASGRG